MQARRLAGLLVGCFAVGTAFAADADRWNLPIATQKLDNGLTVVVSEDHSAPVVGVSVVYHVGMRLEPKNRTGFAHLFEHLMFQGTPNAKKGVFDTVITGGSGITPVMSMLRSLDARGELPDIAHVHFAKNAREVIFGDELRALAAKHPRYRLTLVHTTEDPRRLDSERLQALVPDWRSRETWACGPQALLDTVTACFAGHHLSAALHVERFTAAFVATGGGNGGLVRFGKTGREVRSDGRSPLLRVAEEAGVAAPHGCRMGICHSCDTTLVSGCVRDLRTGERITEPGTRVQTCVCAAAGDVELAL